MLSDLYGRAASWRRAWYARHPDARRRLARPVISVGNLSVGGSGKTPLVATIAGWLLREGQRPAILTRGYGRRGSSDGVLVVSDRTRVIEPVERSGDEPQMLARALPGVPVLVSADRYLAGVLAERAFGATVHVLDDGFQHLPLERDVDLLIVTPDDLEDRVLPSGHLREPLSAMKAASAIIRSSTLSRPVRGSDPLVASSPGSDPLVGSPVGSDPFQMHVRVGAVRAVHPFGTVASVAGKRAVAVAGIAKPHRFFATAREQGWDVVSELPFRDHHWFSDRDVARILNAARGADADVVLTTEKDAVRLQPLAGTDGHAPPFVYLPIEVSVQPEAEFFAWLRQRIA